VVFVVPIVHLCGVGGFAGCFVGGFWYLFSSQPPSLLTGAGAIGFWLMGLILLIAFVIAAKGLALVLQTEMHGPVDKEVDRLRRIARGLFGIVTDAGTAAGRVAKGADKAKPPRQK